MSIFLVVLAGCGSVSVTLPEEIGSDFDLEATLDDLRDCEALGDTFVAVVREAAGDLDSLAEESSGSVPEARLAEKVDAVTATAYYELAERLGCDAVQQRLDTVDRLRDIDPSSAAGEELVTQVIRRLHQQR